MFPLYLLKLPLGTLWLFWNFPQNFAEHIKKRYTLPSMNKLKHVQRNISIRDNISGMIKASLLVIWYSYVCLVIVRNAPWEYLPDVRSRYCFRLSFALCHFLMREEIQSRDMADDSIKRVQCLVWPSSGPLDSRLFSWVKNKNKEPGNNCICRKNLREISTASDTQNTFQR